MICCNRVASRAVMILRDNTEAVTVGLCCAVFGGFEDLPIHLGSCSGRLGHFSGCKFEVEPLNCSGPVREVRRERYVRGR